MKRAEIETEYEIEVDGRIEILRVVIDYNMDLTVKQLTAMLEMIGIANDSEEPKWKAWLINQLMTNEEN